MKVIREGVKKNWKSDQADRFGGGVNPLDPDRKQM